MDTSDATIISRPKRRRVARVAAALTGVAATFLAMTGTAGAYGSTVPCGVRNESTPFTRWNDSAKYFLMPNGGFESGTTDWALTGGATVVTGNETFYVAGSTHTKSLKIPFGATAESRTICISKGEDVIRLFAKDPAVSGAILHVEVIGRNPQTGAVGQTAFDVNAGTRIAWLPTIRLGVPALFTGDGYQELTFKFTTRGTPATWYIDDVYVDPFKNT